MKRILALVLSVVLVMTVLPTGMVSAESDNIILIEDEITSEINHYLWVGKTFDTPVDFAQYGERDKVQFSFDIRVNKDEATFPEALAEVPDSEWIRYIQNGSIAFWTEDTIDEYKYQMNMQNPPIVLNGSKVGDYDNVIFDLPDDILRDGKISRIEIYIYNNLNRFDPKISNNQGVSVSVKEAKLILGNAVEHSWSFTQHKNSTCQEEGYDEYYCPNGGGHIRREMYPKVSHEYSSKWTIDKEVTCTEAGSKSHHCIMCGDKKDVTEIPYTGHSYATEWTIDVNPTCTDAGSKSHHCIMCGDKKDVAEIPYTGHSYATEWVIDVDPTCTETGSKSHHCGVCGDKKDVTDIPALGHSFDIWETVTAPTFQTAGKEKRTCSVCKETEQKDLCKIVLGNVDFTGVVTAADALLTLQASTSKVTLKSYEVLAANVDEKQGITANDALMILQYATKKITSLDIHTIHQYVQGVCTICGKKEPHTVHIYQYGFCTVCGQKEPHTTHTYYNYRCTACGVVDKSNIHGYLAHFIKTYGFKNGSNYIYGETMDGYDFLLEYKPSTGYIYLSVTESSYSSGSVFTRVYTMLIPKIESKYLCSSSTSVDGTIASYAIGEVTAASYTSNGYITPKPPYEGYPELEEIERRTLTATTSLALMWLDIVLIGNDTGITIKDLGFTSF